MADLDLLVESVSRRRSVLEESWSSLADEILEQVLALLSFPEVYRLRSVCKRWNALIHSVQFHERALRSGLPWGPFYPQPFEWSGEGSCAVPWFAFDISEATMRKTIMPQLEFPECVRGDQWSLVAAGGGLLCFASRRRFLVCNPMTKVWRELPDECLDWKGFSVPRWVRITPMVMDQCGSSYKFLFASHVGVGIYDSAANKWSAVEPLSSEMSLERRAYLKDNGEVYVLGKMVTNGPHMVMILELSTLRWREDTIPMPATFVECPHLVARCGEVYLVGGNYELLPGKRMESILLFRLDPGGRWTRVSEYVNHALLDQIGLIHGCRVHGGQIFVALPYHDGLWIVMYNFITGVWEEPIKHGLYHMFIRYETEFAFQPNLIAAP